MKYVWRIQLCNVDKSLTWSALEIVHRVEGEIWNRSRIVGCKWNVVCETRIYSCQRQRMAQRHPYSQLWFVRKQVMCFFFGRTQQWYTKLIIHRENRRKSRNRASHLYHRCSAVRSFRKIVIYLISSIVDIDNYTRLGAFVSQHSSDSMSRQVTRNCR